MYTYEWLSVYTYEPANITSQRCVLSLGFASRRLVRWLSLLALLSLMLTWSCILTCYTLMFYTRQSIDQSLAEIAGCSRTGSKKKDFPKGTFDLKGPRLNVVIRDKISFVGVAHLTRSDRSCCGRCRCQTRS